MGLTLTPLFTENFTPNANPLNPANWTAATGFGNLKAIGGLCETAGASGAPGAELYIGSAIPNDCYVSFKIGAWNMAGSAGASFLGGGIRDTNDLADGWSFFLTDNGDGTTQVEAASTVGGVTVDVYNRLHDVNPIVGDVYTMVVIGKTGYAFKNGALLGGPVTIPGGTASGSIAAAVGPAVDVPVAQIALSQFIIGSASGSLSKGGGRDFSFRFKF